jgi:Tol biopolymer transport system component
MVEEGGEDKARVRAPAVFLSYASQDAAAAVRICSALREAGVEVWFDQSELRGGDVWDQRIRREIRDCTLFIPVISANTASRHEGYFRLEWDLADQRTHMMARDRAFIVPVCLDATKEAATDVPESFHRVQWTRLLDGNTPPAFTAHIVALLSAPGVAPSQRASRPPGTESFKASSDAAPVNAVAAAPVTDESGETLGARASRARVTGRTWLSLGVLLLAIAATLTWWATRKAESAGNPLANASFSRLAGLEGVGRAAAISRDGKFVAFLANRAGKSDVWVSEVGSGTYRNLTRSEQREFTSPKEIRTLGFSPDSSLVSIWTRSSDGSRPEDVNILAVPIGGGPLRTYLPEVAEYDWSHDGRKLVFHTTAPGDPIFVREPGSPDRLVYVARAGVHCHFPVWSPDDAFIYFARGIPTDGVWDIWRVRPSGAGLERLTTHNSYVAYPTLLDQRTMVYLATSGDGSGPWLYTLDTERRVPDRISFGLETYTSLGASADGKRLVATVVYSGSSLWRLTLRAKDGAPATAPTPALLSADGAHPRLGSDYVLYVAWQGGKQGIWTLRQGATREIWSSTHSLIAGVPAISPDGRHIAFITREGDRALLYVIDPDGSHSRIIADSLALRGNPAWAPDGQSILTAVVREEEPHLTRVFLNGAPIQPLVAEYSVDPVWSPDGSFLVYSGADIGTTFPLRAAARDGRPYPLPTMILTRGARRVAFSPDGQSLVILRGDFDHKDFWLIDLRTGAEHMLAKLPAEFVIGDFDISPDGSEILFDRVEKNSELALIERAHSSANP